MAVLMTLALVFSLAMSTAFAATSPTSGNKPVTKSNAGYTSETKTGTCSTYKSGKATIKTIKMKKAKKYAYFGVITYNKVKYNVYKVNKNAFSKTKKSIRKKLKGIKIYYKNVRFAKGAFKGLSTRKMTAYVKKNISKSAYKKIKANLKKAGWKGKVKRY